MRHDKDRASYSVPVLPGSALRAVAGANLGDTIDDLDGLTAGDVYRLSSDAKAITLAIEDGGLDPERSETAPILRSARQGHRIAASSDAGRRGAAVAIAARLTFLAPDGHSVDVMALTVGADAPSPYLFALGPLQAGMDYTLAGAIDPDDLPDDALRLADVAPFGFASGTRITMADGSQCPVERLTEGDCVLTRDNGAQPLRSVLTQTMRALGPNAPVVVTAETLGNPGDLILSPHQRILVYQRGDDRLTETAEMLVRASDLVDDVHIFVRDGGFVEYVTLVLENHEMLYAECVNVESLEVGAATRHRLKADHARAVEQVSHAPHYGTEAGRDLAAAARARLLRPKP